VQKPCTRCGEEKPLEEFRFNAVTGRYSYVCMTCWVPVRQTREIHSSMEKYLAQKFRYTTPRKGHSRMRQILPFNLTLDDVTNAYEAQDGKCAVTGIELTHGEHTKHTNASIDRIDPERGYEPSNIRLVCSIVNVMRMRLSDEELGIWSLRIARGLGFCK